jgi:ceramide glucosyltransferase
MNVLVWLVFACAAIAAAYQLFQVFAAWLFLRRTRALAAPPPGRPLPPVTLLKPLKGPGVDLYANLASFCRLDYPSYQIVFGVEEATDPAVAVVQQLRRDFPERDLVLSVDQAPGTNRKVANLRHMMTHARHAILVMSDSDVRVRPDYLRVMVGPLVDGKLPAKGEQRIGLTTCLYRGVGRFGLPSVFESLFINTDFTPMVLSAQLVQRFRYAYGASIAFRREALDRIGGFGAIADYLADDYLLGNRIADAGYKLVLLPYVVDTVLDSVRLRDVWRHLLRWSRTYRVQQPAGWFASVITHAVLWGTLSLLVSGGSAAGWTVFATAVGVRLGSLAAILRLLREPDTQRHLWLVPLKDLVASAMWAAAFLGRTVEWSDQVFRVERDGRMVALTPKPPAHAEAVEARLRAAGS